MAREESRAASGAEWYYCMSSHVLTVVVGSLDVHLSAGSVLVHAVLCINFFYLKKKIILRVFQ